MITRPTLLILGAGASINYGFPSGLQLKAEICLQINNKGDIYEDLLRNTDEKEHVQDFYNNLLLSSEMSIDAFLEHNRKYLNIGRRAIANVLIRKERHKELFDNWINKWLDPTNKDRHWYQLLFSKLNSPFEEFEKNKLKIITFNYDRSLEYFLLKSMKAKYSENDPKSVLEKLKTIPILHMYGKLGNLPEYDSEDSPVPYDLFGSNKESVEYWWRKYINKASQKIFTIHQVKEMGDVLTKAQEYINEAQRIYFLGFGYDKTNMERLFIKEKENILKRGTGSKCWGTTLGISTHHKRYLAEYGFQFMADDLRNEAHGNTYIPYRFPNSTIYDFLYYNPHSVLD